MLVRIAREFALFSLVAFALALSGSGWRLAGDAHPPWRDLDAGAAAGRPGAPALFAGDEEAASAAAAPALGGGPPELVGEDEVDGEAVGEARLDLDDEALDGGLFEGLDDEADGDLDEDELGDEVEGDEVDGGGGGRILLSKRARLARSKTGLPRSLKLAVSSAAIAAQVALPCSAMKIPGVDFLKAPQWSWLTMDTPRSRAPPMDGPPSSPAKPVDPPPSAQNPPGAQNKKGSSPFEVAFSKAPEWSWLSMNTPRSRAPSMDGPPTSSNPRDGPRGEGNRKKGPFDVDLSAPQWSWLSIDNRRAPAEPKSDVGPGSQAKRGFEAPKFEPPKWSWLSMEAVQSSLSGPLGAWIEESSVIAEKARQFLFGQTTAPGLRFERELGRGVSAAVYEGTMETPQGRKLLAVKAVKVNDANRAYVEREVELMSKFSGGSFLRFYGAQRFEDHYLLLMELAGKNLKEKVIDRQFENMDVNTRLILFRQIVEGIVELSSEGVAHRDLKPQNILLTKEGAKIMDFGVSGCINTRGTLALSPEELTDKVGSPAYKAPEQWNMDPMARYTLAGDVWSAGMMLYQMLFEGIFPLSFYQVDETPDFDNFANIVRSLDITEDRVFRGVYVELRRRRDAGSEKLLILLARMLNPDPTIRIPIEGVEAALGEIARSKPNLPVFQYIVRQVKDQIWQEC